MVDTIFVHLGAHKTATTLLQVRLEDMQSTLSKSGIAYLGPRIANRAGLSEYLRSAGGKVSDVAAALQNLLPDATRHLLIVNEDFLGVMDPTRMYPDADLRLRRLLDVFKAAIPEAKVRPFLVVRRFDHFWLSCFRHDAKKGKLRSFEDMSSQLAACRNLHWRPVVERLEKELGQRIPVRKYEDFIDLEGNELLRVLFQAANIEVHASAASGLAVRKIKRFLASAVSKSQRVLSGHPNPALSDRGVLLAYAIRPLVDYDEWERLFRPILTRYFNRYTEPDPGYLLVSTDVERRCIEAYDADCAWLGDRLTACWDQ